MASPAQYPRLAEGRQCDVAIVGAGFAGLSAALHLAEMGASVIVLDATQPGWGASGRNNGQVIPGLKLDPDELDRKLGTAAGERMAHWSGDAPDLVFRLIAKHHMDCSPVRKGWIQSAHSADGVKLAQARVRQWRQRGADVRVLDRADVTELIGARDYVGGWLDTRGGAVHPLCYALGLARVASSLGAAVHGGSRASSLSSSGDRLLLSTREAVIEASHVLVATGGYADSLISGLRTSFIPVRTAQVASAPLPPQMRARILPKGHVTSDTRRLLTSARLSPDGRLVMGGAWATGGSHSVGLEERLHHAARVRFGHLGEFDWQYGWSGLFAVTQDHVPHVHRLGGRVWAVLGCNGRGIAVSTALGLLMARAIAGRPDADAEVPITHIRSYPFHRYRRVGIRVATEWKRIRDDVDRMSRSG